MGQRLRPGRLLAALAAFLLPIVASIVLGATSPLRVAAAADSSFDSDLLSLINGDRTSNGLPALQPSSALQGVAESTPYGGCGFTVDGRAEDMLERNYFSHTILNCGSANVFTMMRAEGIPFGAGAENIGWTSGLDDPAAAAKWINDHFMSSTEHRDNILDGSYTTVGIGSWRTASGQTWTGAGSSQTDAIVVAVEFTNAPTSAPAPKPVVHHTTTTVAPVHHAAAAAATAAPTPTPTATPVPPPLPDTGVVLLTSDAAQSGAGQFGTAATVYETGARQVPAMVGKSLLTPTVSGALSSLAVFVLGGSWGRRRERRRMVSRLA